MPQKTDLLTNSPAQPQRRGIGAIETGLELLDVLASAPGPMKLKEIAAAAGMAPAKAHRYLASFAAGGMVSQAGKSGRYDLGPLAVRLGVVALGRVDIVARAREGLADLRDVLQETCFVAVWSDRGPIIVDWQDSLRPVTVIVERGSILPILISSTGRTCLGFMPSAQLTPLIETEAATDPKAHVKAAALGEEARQTGFGRVVNDFQDGIASLALPLHDPLGQMVGTVTALGRSDEFDHAVDGQVARQLRLFAEGLGA
jgi:DNA-binding IclR family transcriptional regulator